MDKKRILIVDDEVGASRLLKASLEQTNHYEVRVENWPEDAMAAAHQFRPDLVLLDIIMPRMSGGSVAAVFGSDPELKSTPIVFLTAAVRRYLVNEHEGTICEHPCLAKPASVQEIIQCIETHLPRTPDPTGSSPVPTSEKPSQPLSCTTQCDTGPGRRHGLPHPGRTLHDQSQKTCSGGGR